MIDTKQRDLKRGRRGSLVYALPVMEKICGGTAYLADTQKNTFERSLDCDFSIDGVAVGDKGLIGFASRVQFGRKYESFSIRCGRRNGKPTEYQKISEALKSDALRPEYHLQAFVDDETGAAVVGVVKTDDLFKFLQDNLPTIKRLTAPDGNTFLTVSWRDLDRAGVGVKKFAVDSDGVIEEIKE